MTRPQEVGATSIKNETQETISKRIIAGKSTKADVLRELGEPTSRDKDDSGNGVERWQYAYFNHQSQVLGALPFASLIKHDNSTATRYVDVIFKPNGVVRSVDVKHVESNSTVGFL
ncbi:MAG: hypothetical protein KGO49_14065 [Gammaproteobacteria bacterium]|nr:hypothetical protein [Gammaproteobacteria bacterium]